MNPETIEALAAVPADTAFPPSPMPTGSSVAFGVWTRDIEALCRALDAQQRAHFRSSPAQEE